MKAIRVFGFLLTLSVIAYFVVLLMFQYQMEQALNKYTYLPSDTSCTLNLPYGEYYINITAKENYIDSVFDTYEFITNFQNETLHIKDTTINVRISPYSTSTINDNSFRIIGKFIVEESRDEIKIISSLPRSKIFKIAIEKFEPEKMNEITQQIAIYYSILLLGIISFFGLIISLIVWKLKKA